MFEKNYTPGDIDLQLNIHNEKNVTIEFVVDEAVKMWRTVKKKNILYGDLQASEDAMAELQRVHPDFCKSYPIVLRYMCQMQEFDKKAFTRYLNKINAKPYKSEEEYLDSQTDYVVLLYKHRNPRWNKAHVANLRVNVRNMLQQEHETFKKYATDFDKEVTDEYNQQMQKNRNELYDFAKLIGPVGMTAAGTFRVETDILPPDESVFEQFIKTTVYSPEDQEISVKSLLE